MQNKLEVGNSIFFNTATITKVTRDKIQIKCHVCGETVEITILALETKRVTMCTKCKYGKTRNKCIRIMKQNKEKLEKELREIKEQAELAEYNRLNKGKLQIIDEIDDEEYMVRCKDCGKEYLYKRHRFDNSTSPICLKCGKRGAYVNREGETYGDLTITRELGGGEVECVCNICGLTGVYTKAQVVKRLAKCKACRSDRDEVADPIGWTGNIINDIYVVREQLNGTTDVKTYCLICGRLAKVPIGSLMNKTVTCKCHEDKIKIRCRYCGKNTYEIDMVSRRIRCTNNLCPGLSKFSTFDNEYKINIATGLYNITLEEEYNQRVDKLNYVIKGDKHGHKTLVIFKKPIYLGRDRIRYYRCYCLNHRKYILLSYREVGDINNDYNVEYNHDLCVLDYDMDINYIK